MRPGAACRYLAAQHVADPLNPLGVPSYYQTRWWARVELEPWRACHEMVDRRVLPPAQALELLSWRRKEIAYRLMARAISIDHRPETNSG